jgi:endonuclease/exonuclease/phosphatase family metal-dependent hydrolase
VTRPGPSRAFAVLLLATFAGACSSAASDENATDSAATTGESLILNEVLANEPGSDTNAEFIEIVNNGTSSVTLTGFTLSDSVQVRHTFSGSLAAGQAIAVFGGSSAIPAGLTNAVASTTGTLSLGNSGDTVTLKDAAGTTLDTLKYTSALSVDGVSANRATDGSSTASWVLHTTLSSLKDSPGKRVDGSAFTGTRSTDAGTGVDAGKDAGASDSGGGGSTDSGSPATGSFRMLAGNLSSGTKQSYDPGEGQRILEALKPDIALLQEMNYGADDDAAIRGFVTATFGAEFTYAWEGTAGGIQIPNIVVSRFPIVSSGTWTDASVANRGFTYAQIDIPGDHDLWAVSVHLLTTSASNRATEAAQLVGYLQANVPAGDYMTVGGDWNTGSRTEAAVTTFSKLMVTAAPWPADQSGNTDTSENRNDPHDWLVVSPALNAFQVPTVQGTVTVPNGLVFDSRVFTPLSSAVPVLVGDSDPADGMQHEAVVKDYIIK